MKGGGGGGSSGAYGGDDPLPAKVGKVACFGCEIGLLARQGGWRRGNALIGVMRRSYLPKLTGDVL